MYDRSSKILLKPVTKEKGNSRGGMNACPVKNRIAMHDYRAPSIMIVRGKKQKQNIGSIHRKKILLAYVSLN